MAQTTKTFRVFVSSTFSDLKEERNALQKHVFPRLRDLCARHGCRFQAIDLRWGVREEAGLDQHTMRICLDEVSRCQRTSPRPNFIVLLGDRYGWRPLPAQIPAREFRHLETTTDGRQLLDMWYRRDDNARYKRNEQAEPEAVYCLQPRSGRFVDFQVWEREVERPLRDILAHGIRGLDQTEDERRKYEASATEQEIAAGALKVPDAIKHVFCFFRKIERLTHDESARDFIDLDEHGQLDSQANTKLGDLKTLLEDRLRGNIHSYRASWSGGPASTEHIGHLPADLEGCRALMNDPAAPKTICIDVWKRLASVIEDEIARLESIEPLEREIADHRAFAQGRARLFVGRKAMLDMIGDYLRSTDRRPLAVWGESGSGKSALMAKAIANFEVQAGNCETVSRFIGATPASSEGRSLLDGLCRQLTRSYRSDEAAIPTDYRELAKEFGERLKLATPQKPLVVFLDALDQLSDSDHARNLAWLPAELPENVRLVVSTVPGECKTELERRLPGGLVKLDPMPKEEAGELLEAWLKEAGRTLQEDQTREVLDKFALSATGSGDDGSADKKAHGMPLYLKLAFEEARRWKSYTHAIELSPGIPGIVQQLFDRLSLDANHGKVIVDRGLGYLAAARNGLSEDELLDVLARDVDVYANFLRVSRHIPSDLLPYLTSHLQEIGETRSAEAWLKELYGHEDRLRAFVSMVLGRAPELKLPVILWSRLYFDLEPYLSERSAEGASLLSFYHRQIREVVEQAFLAGDERRRRHEHLAEYFGGQELFEPEKKTPNVRKLSELPYQQTCGERWDDLYKTLTDFSFLEAKITHVAVIKSGLGENVKTIYGGVYELQEDYRRALEKLPA